MALAFICAIHLSAQQNTHLFDLQAGYGFGSLSGRTNSTQSVELQLNYKISPVLSVGISGNFGNSGFDTYNLSNISYTGYLMESVNLFYSPATNRNSNNFKIGTGLSNINRTYIDSKPQGNSGSGYSTNSAVGLNIIVEDEQIVFKHFLIGGKLFLTPFFDGTTIVGGMVKIGVLL